VIGWNLPSPLPAGGSDGEPRFADLPSWTHAAASGGGSASQLKLIFSNDFFVSREHIIHVSEDNVADRGQVRQVA
jgi:hypothetical protein